MPTTAEARGDRRQIHRRLGPHRHRPALRLDLLEHRRHLGLLGGAHDVDDAFGFLEPGRAPFLVVDHGVDQPAAPDGVGHQPRRGQHPRQHRQPGKRVGVQQRPADRGVVDAQLHQPGRQPVRAGGGPAERPGVGDQPGIQAMRHRQVNRFAPRVEQLGDQQRRRIRGRIHEIGGAEQLVGGVVVDHQQFARRFGQITQAAEPVDAGNVDRHHQIGVAAHRVRVDQQPPTRQRLQRLRQVRRRGEADLHVLAAAGQHRGQRQPGGDRDQRGNHRRVTTAGTCRG
ncbi:hypothetical protein C1Y40_00546 [Mycobacterium talmoniae]|uniref:Uncharacterized protein n=1 Tax=Mycobacterium talmoniae TaxID=1858794 RepID=A0A2S8BRC5_9MYCO|nr:hypothetical protein C1Y40_00546 [Mycobacterium talmoniae]